MAMGTAWWLWIMIWICLDRNHTLKKSSIFQVFLFWAVGTKYNDRCVLFCIVHSVQALNLWSVYFYGFNRLLHSLYSPIYFLLALTGNWVLACAFLELFEELQIQTCWDVDWVHGRTRWIKWEQNRNHEIKWIWPGHLLYPPLAGQWEQLELPIWIRNKSFI